MDTTPATPEEKHGRSSDGAGPRVSRSEAHGVPVQTNIRNERVTSVWDGGFCTESGEGVDSKMFFYSGEPPESWPRALT